MMCPDLFDPEAYARLKKDMGPIAVAGQYQQSPTPRGGNIVQRDWWEVYEPPATSGGKMTFPPMEFVLASLDTAYTEKQENDYSALVVLGIWRDQHHIPKVMLIDAWKRRVTLHGQTPPEGQPRRVQEEYYGLVEWVAHSCKKWKVDKLLVEDKAAGHSVAQEIQRLYGDFDFSTELVTPRGDKLARLYSVVHLFTAGVIYAPDREYADMVINEICAFPKVKHDDLSDAFTQGLRWLRDRGLALRKDEGARDYAHRTAPPGVLQPLYDV